MDLININSQDMRGWVDILEMSIGITQDHIRDIHIRLKEIGTFETKKEFREFLGQLGLKHLAKDSLKGWKYLTKRIEIGERQLGSQLMFRDVCKSLTSVMTHKTLEFKKQEPIVLSENIGDYFPIWMKLQKNDDDGDIFVLIIQNGEVFIKAVEQMNLTEGSGKMSKLDIPKNLRYPDYELFYSNFKQWIAEVILSQSVVIKAIAENTVGKYAYGKSCLYLLNEGGKELFFERYKNELSAIVGELEELKAKIFHFQQAGTDAAKAPTAFDVEQSKILYGLLLQCYVDLGISEHPGQWKKNGRLQFGQLLEEETPKWLSEDFLPKEFSGMMVHAVRHAMTRYDSTDELLAKRVQKLYEWFGQGRIENFPQDGDDAFAPDFKIYRPHDSATAMLISPHYPEFGFDEELVKYCNKLRPILIGRAFLSKQNENALSGISIAKMLLSFKRAVKVDPLQYQLLTDDVFITRFFQCELEQTGNGNRSATIQYFWEHMLANWFPECVRTDGGIYVHFSRISPNHQSIKGFCIKNKFVMRDLVTLWKHEKDQSYHSRFRKFYELIESDRELQIECIPCMFDEKGILVSGIVVQVLEKDIQDILDTNKKFKEYPFALCTIRDTCAFEGLHMARLYQEKTSYYIEITK